MYTYTITHTHSHTHTHRHTHTDTDTHTLAYTNTHKPKWLCEILRCVMVQFARESFLAEQRVIHFSVRVGYQSFPYYWWGSTGIRIFSVNCPPPLSRSSKFNSPPRRSELASYWLKFTLARVKTFCHLLFRISIMCIWGGGGNLSFGGGSTKTIQKTSPRVSR